MDKKATKIEKSIDKSYSYRKTVWNIIWSFRFYIFKCYYLFYDKNFGIKI